MIGWFVQHEHVRPLDRKPTEDQTCGFAPGESLQPFLDIVPGEEHPGHPAADETDVLARTKIPNPFLGSAGECLELFLTILCKITQMSFVSPLHRTRIRGLLPHDDFEESGLADAVGPDDRQPFAPLHQKIHTVQHGILTKCFLDSLDSEHIATAVASWLEPKRGIAARALWKFLQRIRFLLNQTDSTLCLACLTRLRTKSIHKLLMVRDLTLPSGDILYSALAFRPLGLEKRAVVSAIGQHRFVVDIQNDGGDVVEEPMIVRDYDQESSKIPHKDLEPANGYDVEVVGGLIEQQDIGSAGQNLSQQHPELESTGKSRHRIAMHLRRNAETLENGGSPSFGGVSVVPLDDLL